MERLLLNLIRLKGGKELSLSEWQIMEEDIKKMGFEIQMPSGLSVSEVFKEGISKLKGLNCSEIYTKDMSKKIGELYFSVSDKGTIKIERYVPNRNFVVVDGNVLYDFDDKFFDSNSWRLVDKKVVLGETNEGRFRKLSKENKINDLIEIAFALACEFEKTEFPKITTLSKIAQELLIAIIYSNLIEVDSNND